MAIVYLSAIYTSQRLLCHYVVGVINLIVISFVNSATGQRQPTSQTSFILTLPTYLILQPHSDLMITALKL